MASLHIEPLDEELGFGARITGVTQEALIDEGVRKRLREVFEDRGLIVFKDMEPTPRMQVQISLVFGPLKDHPVPTVPRVDQEQMPGVIDMRYEAGEPNSTVIELDGKPLAHWLPWHFDHCYNDKLNRAGVLRAVDIPDEGGYTGFADGIQLYDEFPSGLLGRIEGKEVLYRLNVVLEEMKFGVPATFRPISTKTAAIEMNEYAKSLPRAIHPAIWRRSDGRKVLHVSPWMAEGIEGMDAAQGDALLEEVCREIHATVRPYWHRWRAGDMVIWDNWRMLHAVSGCDPRQSRRMQRTTIEGDYGLGRIEGGAESHRVLRETMV